MTRDDCITPAKFYSQLGGGALDASEEGAEYEL